MKIKDDFEHPFKVIDLKQSRFTPPHDIMINSVYMENAHYFLWKSLSVTIWPELGFILVDSKGSHYFGFFEYFDTEKCDYVINWYVRTMFGLKPVDEPLFAIRYVTYAFGYCKVGSFRFTRRTL